MFMGGGDAKRIWDKDDDISLLRFRPKDHDINLQRVRPIDHDVLKMMI